MKKILILLMLAGTFSGCIKEDENCPYDECQNKAPDSEIATLQSYLTSNGIVATQHCSGLFYVVDEQGPGKKPTACKTISINYEGKLTNGTVFDKTQPGSPATFNISQLITGFKNGLPLLRTGGKMRLYVPPSLGYGSRQAGSIPPNSIIIFTVELLSIQ